MNKIYFDNAEAICNILSCMLYNIPNDDFYHQMKSDILINWPLFINSVQDVVKDMHISLLNQEPTQLISDYYQLFIGPGKKSAYPCGSVYTDKDNLLYGSSCVAFEKFTKLNQINIEMKKKQPSDHIGIIIIVLGYLLKERKTHLALLLINEHLLPWLPLFLRCLKENAKTGFYRNLSKLIELFIKDLIFELNVYNSKIKL